MFAIEMWLDEIISSGLHTPVYKDFRYLKNYKFLKKDILIHRFLGKNREDKFFEIVNWPFESPANSHCSLPLTEETLLSRRAPNKEALPSPVSLPVLILTPQTCQLTNQL